MVPGLAFFQSILIGAKRKTSYLPPVGSISEENADVEQAGREAQCRIA
jgi:hypothetical protein